jgi:hypothetical protein
MARLESLSDRESLAFAAELEQLSMQAGCGDEQGFRASWERIERPLLAALRAGESAASLAGSDSPSWFAAVPENERLRNLVWEISVTLELSSVHVAAMRRLAQLLRRGVGGTPPRQWTSGCSASA